MGVKPLGGRTIEVLSPQEIEQIHHAVIDVLKDPGIHIDHEEALFAFEKAGADINISSKSVHLSEHHIDEALRQVPRSMTVCGREPKHDIKSLDGVHYSNGHGATLVIDFDTGERRLATKKDLETHTILHDALENSHFIFPQIYPQDVSPKALDRHISQALLNNTTKPVIATAFNREAAKDLIEMGVAIAGSEEALRKRPMFTVSHGMISPFSFEPNRVDVLFEMCRRGLPFQIYTIPASGTTAPITLAGTLVVMVAELLAGLVLTQLVNKGTPVRLMGYAGISDMRSGAFTFTAPEAALMSTALAQVLRFYGVPQAVHGSTTRANVLDAQAGYETGILNLFSALSGSDIVIECTSSALENTLVGVLEQAVIGNEICNFINRILQGITVNSDTLAVDTIRDVGVKGEYLTHKHTLDFFRSEQWDPQIGNRSTRERWEEEGCLDVQRKAKNRVSEILAKHRPKPLDAKVQSKIQEIVDRAEGN